MHKNRGIAVSKVFWSLTVPNGRTLPATPKYGQKMHIRRKSSTNQVWENVNYYEQKNYFEGRSKDEKTERITKTSKPHAGNFFKEDAWKRIRKSVAKVFCRKSKSDGKNVPYTSLTRLDRLSISEDELKKSQKRLRFCLKRTEQEEDVFDYEQCEESDDEDCDSIFVQRRESFEKRRMAICKEIERNTTVAVRSRSTSLLELRKTLVINNRFKEMGL